jgi:hypothetical protein
MADTMDLKSVTVRCSGSSPEGATNRKGNKMNRNLSESAMMQLSQMWLTREDNV